MDGIVNNLWLGYVFQFTKPPNSVSPDISFWKLFSITKAIAFDQPKPQESKAYISLAEAFSCLLQEWNRDTMASSSPTQWWFHPAYQEILGMGPAALPLIMMEFEKNPARWTYALKNLARKDAAEGAKDVDEMKAAWRRWSKDFREVQNG